MSLRNWTLVALLTVPGCASAKLDPATEQRLEKHELILAAMTEYFSGLQARGVLPKPEAKKTDL